MLYIKESENSVFRSSNILHVSRYVHVGSGGGTERYLLDLIRELGSLECNSQIAWLAQGHKSVDSFEDENGIIISPFHVPAGYVDVPPPLLQKQFTAYLRNCSVDIIHFHTFSISEAVLAAVAYSEGIPYVFTYHSPAWSCRRGDLLQWGTEICDGKVRPWRCSACMIQQRLQCSVSIAWNLTGVLAPLGLLGRYTQGKLHRRTAFVNDTVQFQKALETFLKNAEKAVACAEWSVPVLKLNGASPERIVHSPQGVPMDFVRAITPTGSQSREQTIFNVGYVGRVTWVKGVHILVEAFVRTVYPQARLKIYGCNDTRSDAPYLHHLKQLANADPRIEFISQLPFDTMLDEYRKFNLLAIPSVWLETGPFTLLEAAALGIEVWGSETIGQMHMLKQHGRVVRPNTVETWHNALKEAFEKHSTGRSKRIDSNTPVLRTMQDVANEMSQLYTEILTIKSQTHLL